MRFIAIILLLVSTISYGQKVTVADEINIRNYYAYDMLGYVGNNTLLYLDKGLNHYINVYDKDLKYKRNKELTFEKRRVRVHYLVPLDTTFNLVYSFKERDTIYYKINTYDHNAVMIDSLTMLKEPTTITKPKNFRYATSEDNSKTVLFAQDQGRYIYVRVIDNVKKEVIWHADVELKNLDTWDDFRQITVTNEGIVIYLFEQNNSRYSREDHWLTLLGIYQGSIILQTKVDLKDRISNDIELSFNNKTGNVVVAGLSSEKKSDEATEYFFVNKHISNFKLIEVPQVEEIGLDFVRAVYGRKKNKEKALKNFKVHSIMNRHDGGFLLIAEMDREYQRRTAFNQVPRANRNNNNNSPMRGWTDYYNEDIVMFSIHPDGEEHWKEVLFKKQFSQDDGGIFSSFYLFKTPSRIKLIYNDEIKNNNTVSEYVLNPIGQFERNSLLSTEYQNLRLRFRDALQLNNQELLISSEKNYNLRLVKIDYTPI